MTLSEAELKRLEKAYNDGYDQGYQQFVAYAIREREDQGRRDGYKAGDKDGKKAGLKIPPVSWEST